jgi:hypothetical protein
MRAFLFNPYTGEPRPVSEVVDDPQGLRLVDPHEPLRSLVVPRRSRMPADRGLWAPSWAVVARLGEHCDGRRAGVCWFFDWAVREGFVSGAEFQKRRGDPG